MTSMKSIEYQQGGSAEVKAPWPAYSAIAVSVAVFVAIAWVTLAKANNIGSDAAVALVAALVPGVISVVISVLGHVSQMRASTERERAREQDAIERKDMREAEEKERERTRYEEIVLKSLDFFTGHTQRRNVGISIVEGAWDRASHLRPVFVPLLVNQAVYLLNESGQTDSSHEAQNLKRMMGLIMAAAATNEFPTATFAPLLGPLDRRVENQQVGRGVAVSPSDASLWRRALPNAADVQDD